MEGMEQVPCHVCGQERTVKSHIIPKRFTLAIREDAKSAVLGSRFKSGIRKTQGGVFSPDMLCEGCENLTADLDRYGWDFVQRVNQLSNGRKSEALIVENPEPEVLGRFVLSLIWRNCHASGFKVSRETLGPYDQEATSVVFGSAPMRWPVLASLDQFKSNSSGQARLVIYPWRTRFGDRTAWAVTLSTLTFFLIIDNRGPAQRMAGFEAQHDNPLQVVVSDPQNIESVPILQELFRSMRRKR